VGGRADVLNLLRIDIKNTVAVEGTQVPKSIIDLAKRKENVTAFLDGDRGGTIILNELLQVAKVDYVARAPDGYEVEELTRKHMIKALQNKKPAKMAKDSGFRGDSRKDYKGKAGVLFRILKKLKIQNEQVIIDAINSIESGNAIGFNKSLDKTFDLPARELFEQISNYKDTKYLVIAGILSSRLLSLALNIKIKFIACKNKTEDLFIPDKLSVYYF